MVKPRVIEKIVRGERRWRVIIPKALTGGKQKTRWFRSRKQAEAFADRVELDKLNRSNGYELLTMTERAAISHLLGKCNGLDGISRAVEFWIAHKATETRTVRQVIVEFESSKLASSKSVKYLQSLSNTLRRFSERFADFQIHSISGKEIEEWAYSQGWQPATITGYLKDVTTLFSFALKRRYVTLNPVGNVERPQVAENPPVIMLVNECAALMKCAQESDHGLIPFLALCLFGGLRPWEARSIALVDLKPGHVEVAAEKSKGRKRRLVTVNETLKAWLDVPGGEYASVRQVNHRGKMVEKPAPIVGLEKRMRNLRKLAGVKWHHDILRHSFVSYHFAIHGAAATAREAGHSEAVLFQHYRELVTREEAERFWAIKPG